MTEPTTDDLLRFLRAKITEAEKALKAREEAEAIWRSGDDDAWAAAARLHPSTVRKPMKKAERLQAADRERRIAAKARHELEMFKAVFAALHSPDY